MNLMERFWSTPTNKLVNWAIGILIILFSLVFFGAVSGCKKSDTVSNNVTLPIGVRVDVEYNNGTVESTNTTPL